MCAWLPRRTSDGKRNADRLPLCAKRSSSPMAPDGKPNMASDLRAQTAAHATGCDELECCGYSGTISGSSLVGILGRSIGGVAEEGTEVCVRAQIWTKLRPTRALWTKSASRLRFERSRRRGSDLDELRILDWAPVLSGRVGRVVSVRVANGARWHAEHRSGRSGSGSGRPVRVRVGSVGQGGSVVLLCLVFLCF